MIRQRIAPPDPTAAPPHWRYVFGRRPLRPEAKLRYGLPAPQHVWPATDRPLMSADVRRWPWRLSLTSSLSLRACADGCWWPGTWVAVLPSRLPSEIPLSNCAADAVVRRVRTEPVLAPGCTVRPAD